MNTIEKLESGVVPWFKSWSTFGVPGRNAVTHTRYSGINWWTTMLAGYRSPYWLTLYQTNQLGGRVRKGEKSTIIAYYRFETVTQADGNIEQQFRGVRHYRVFNLEQIDLPPAALPAEMLTTAEEFRPNTAKRLQQGEDLWLNWENKPQLVFGSEAMYSPASDNITIPRYERFSSPAEYYSTLFHEAVHATGHESRLGRPGITEPHRFGSSVYALEELIAELGSARICCELGIEQETIDNSASYIDHWIRTIKETPSLVWKAAAAAEQAFSCISGFTAEEAGADSPAA